MRILVTALLCASLVACAGLREKVILLSEEDLQNAETIRQVAKNNLETWALKSGILHGALEPRLDEFPLEAVKAMQELTALAEKYKQGELSDYELGYSLGLKVRMLGAVVLAAVKQFAPDILDIFPALIL